MGQSGSTMQLTRAADYAVRVMIHLATLPAQERTLLPALATATGAPKSFLSKVLQALCRAGSRQMGLLKYGLPGLAEAPCDPGRA